MKLALSVANRRKSRTGSSLEYNLAAKTCCKDRWRQVLSEADCIKMKHLFTLQEGVSPNQLVEMEAGGLQLVVPEPNLKSFSKEWREKILDLESFVSLVGNRQVAG